MYERHNTYNCTNCHQYVFSEPGHTGVFIKESLKLKTPEFGHLGVFIKGHWN